MSQEKLLYESKEEIVEATPNAPETIAPGTGQTDIAQQAPKTRLARAVLTQSLPYMIGFVQPLTAPVSFVFGFKERQDTQIPGGTMPYAEQQPPSHEPYGDPVSYIGDPSRTTSPADPQTSADEDGLGGTIPAEVPTDTTPQPEDPVIIRRLVETDVREVVFDLTNEAIQDINALFSSDFPDLLQKFIQEGGELYGFPESDTDTGMSNFFLPQMMNKATQKINTDFIEWVDTTSRPLGTVTIASLNDMPTIFTAIGEMRETLSTNTNKSGSVFILCTPRIANYIAGTLGMTNSNGGEVLERGKPNQNPHLNGFIGQFGDVKVYQYRGSRTDTSDSIVMGFDGDNGPNTASVYYHPYKEYLIQGGDNYMTGHSNIFYRVRDTWGVNPLDTFNKSFTSPDGPPTDTSDYLVKATFDIQQKAITP